MYDSDSLLSKASYVLVFLSSLISVCIDLSKILKWGTNPVIRTYWSFIFLKVVFFILTKFLVFAYVISMAMKSLMFYFAITTAANGSKNLFHEVLQLYYRGLNNGPELLTFNQATVIAPFLILTLLFLPSVALSAVFCVWHSSQKVSSMNFVQKAVLFFFAVFSNMSYFARRSESIKECASSRAAAIPADSGMYSNISRESNIRSARST